MIKVITGKLARKLAVLYLVAVLGAAWGYAIGRPGIFYSSFVQKKFNEIYAFFNKKLWEHGPEETWSKFQYAGFKQRDPGFVDTGYLLLPRFCKEAGRDIVEIVRLKDFKTLHTWVLPIKEALERCGLQSDAPYTLHPLLLKNGELVFHAGIKGPMVKIDRNSKIMWVLKGSFHHSIEVSSNGNLFACVVNKPSLLESSSYVRDDAYVELTPGGKIVREFSAKKILRDNGYAALYLGTGDIEDNRLNMNNARPIDRDMGSARAGDVALSFRHISTVMLFRPSTGKIIWLKTGPWIHQHDIDPLDDGGYSVLGNDGFRPPDVNNWISLAGISNIYLYYPLTGEVKTPFTSILKKIRMYTYNQGVARILSNGDAFIEETCSSRILRVSPDKVRWEYVNGAAKNTVGALLWSRYVTADEFNEIRGGI